MTLGEMETLTLIQTNNDPDDLSDYQTQLEKYLNEGYNLIYKRYMGVYPSAALSLSTDTPALPEPMHPAIVDYATWLMYRNGNPQKQQRGLYFRSSFESFMSEHVERLGGVSGTDSAVSARFTNLYKS